MIFGIRIKSKNSEYKESLKFLSLYFIFNNLGVYLSNFYVFIFNFFLLIFAF